MSVAEPPVPSLSPPPLSRLLGSLSGPVLGLVTVLALFTVLIGSSGDLGKFLGPRNAQLIAHEATIEGICALGMLLVVVSGGIDLSVGSVVALVSVVTMHVYRRLYGGPDSVAVASAAAVAAGIVTGGLCGLVNGLVITRLHLPPFVATLGMLGIARGLAVWLAERQLMAFPQGAVPAWVDTLDLVHPDIGFFNAGVWSLALLAVLIALLLRQTVLGRYCYAIGSNEFTARLCGVPVAQSKVLLYTLSGLLTGWAGVVMFAHGTSGDPSGGEGLELRVIAAVVIGGASLTGGRGTVVGTLLGVLILQVLNNGVSTYNVPVEAQYILIGVIIIVNTALSQWNSRSSR